MPSNINRLTILEADALRDETVAAINEQLSEGVITDPEEFNLMLIALRNAVEAQNKTIKAFARQLDIRP